MDQRELRVILLDREGRQPAFLADLLVVCPPPLSKARLNLCGVSVATMSPEYYRERRKNNEKYQQQERERNRRRRSSPERKEINRRCRANRRARLHAAFVEHVDHRLVFERDNYICQNCGEQLPVDAAVPQPNAPTLDHIVALSNGGEHSYANSQCLCFMCNATKGAN